MNADNTEDYWTHLDDGLSNKPNMAKISVNSASTYIVAEGLGEVQPLDDQFGHWPIKTVPDGLWQPLFGQPKPNDTDIRTQGDNPKIRFMRTYVIINAALLQWGRSEIEQCGLSFKCLWTGKTASTHEDTSPYLIEIDDKSDFTRRLFTHIAKADVVMTTLHLWQQDLGIFLRSHSDFNTVWSHFQKFTHLQNRQTRSKSTFRFYAPEVFRTIVASFNASQFEKFAVNVPYFMVKSADGSTLMTLSRRSFPYSEMNFIERVL